MLNLLAGAAFSRNLVKDLLRCKGSPMGLFRGQSVRTRDNSATCKVSAFTRTVNQSPGRAGEKRPGCSPSCPFGRPSPFSRVLAPPRALAWPARDDLTTRVHGWAWDCHGQVGWYGDAGLWLERLRSRLHCRRPPSPHALLQKQLQAVWPSLTFELASAVAWRSCFEEASANESSHL